MVLPKTKTQPVSSGVKELIAQLRNEGVQKGQTEAEKIVADANKEAEKILEKAHKEADAFHAKRKKEIANLQSTAEEELQVHFRDVVLKMQEDLVEQFTEKIQRLVTEKTTNEDMLEQMIIEAVGKQRSKAKLDDAKDVEVLLPDGVIGLDYLRKNPDRVKEGRLSKIVTATTANLLRDGVTFSASKDLQAGIKVFLKNEKVEIDMSQKALADMLMEHLQPRFRAILEGVVK